MSSESTLGIIVFIVVALIELGTPLIGSMIEVPTKDASAERLNVAAKKLSLMNSIFIGLAKRIKDEGGMLSQKSVDLIDLNYNYEVESLQMASYYAKEMDIMIRRLHKLLYLGGAIIAPLGIILKFFPSYSYGASDYIFLSVFTGDMFIALYSYILFSNYRKAYKGIRDGIESGRRLRAIAEYEGDDSEN